MIERVGNKFRLVSGKGKNLGTYQSQSQAQHREKQVQFFKNKEQFQKDHPGKRFPPPDARDYNQ